MFPGFSKSNYSFDPSWGPIKQPDSYKAPEYPVQYKLSSSKSSKSREPLEIYVPPREEKSYDNEMEIYSPPVRSSSSSNPLEALVAGNYGQNNNNANAVGQIPVRVNPFDDTMYRNDANIQRRAGGPSLYQGVLEPSMSSEAAHLDELLDEEYNLMVRLQSIQQRIRAQWKKFADAALLIDEEVRNNA